MVRSANAVPLRRQVVQNLPRLPWLRAAQAPQLQALLERASDADLLKALAKAPEKSRNKHMHVPDTGALRALLERIEQARFLRDMSMHT